MIRLAATLFLMAAVLPAQPAVVDPNLQSQLIATGIPGARHQVGSDTAGNVYVAEEIPGGFTAAPIHRIDPGGALLPYWISGSQAPTSVGQMVTNPADGACYLISHWQGGLVHNWIQSIDPTGQLVFHHDVLWGVAHGFTRDTGGDWYTGHPAEPLIPVPQQIYRIPAGQLGIAPEQPWAPGPGSNDWLAPGPAGSIYCADGPAVWRVAAGLPDAAVYTHTPQGGTTFEWRGLIANPLGQGHLVSVLETSPGATTATGRVIWIGPGGPRDLVQALLPLPGDFAIAADATGGLLLISQGFLHRISLASPLPAPPGQLLAPSSHPVATPLTVTLTGTPFALSPFILAVDFPLGPPLFPAGNLPIPPLGVVHTSLGLLPTFLALHDGVGAFGLPDPQAILGPDGSWSATYAPLPPQLAGLTLVLEGYILDGAAPNGLFWITPPVFTSFI